MNPARPQPSATINHNPPADMTTYRVQFSIVFPSGHCERAADIVTEARDRDDASRIAADTVAAGLGCVVHDVTPIGRDDT